MAMPMGEGMKSAINNFSASQPGGILIDNHNGSIIFQAQYNLPERPKGYRESCGCSDCHDYTVAKKRILNQETERTPPMADPEYRRLQDEETDVQIELNRAFMRESLANKKIELERALFNAEMIERMVRSDANQTRR